MQRFSSYLTENTSVSITRTDWLIQCGNIRGAADKSLAQPGRKQATATKLGIFSTHSPRSSIHFLARYSNFCKPPKKTSEVVRPTRSPRQQWPLHRTKNGDLSIVFSVQGTGGSPTGPDQDNKVGDQDIGRPGRPVSYGLQCPVSRGIVVQEQDPLGDFPRRFSVKMFFNCTRRDEKYSAFIVWPFGR